MKVAGCMSRLDKQPSRPEARAARRGQGGHREDRAVAFHAANTGPMAWMPTALPPARPAQGWAAGSISPVVRIQSATRAGHSFAGTPLRFMPKPWPPRV